MGEIEKRVVSGRRSEKVEGSGLVLEESKRRAKIGVRQDDYEGYLEIVGEGREQLG